MTQLSRFWDGTAVGDATAAPYDAATEFARVMQSVSGAGGIATNQSAVFRGELNELAVTGAVTPVSVNTGRAITAGTWYENDAAATLAVATPAVATRIDRVVLRKDWSAAVQTVRLTLIAGVEGGAAPPLVQIWGTTWDEPIAQVSITTGGAITLTDQRQFVGGGPLVNVASFAVGDLLYANSTTTLARLADVAVGSVLVSGGIGVAPAWSAAPTVTSIITGLGAVGTPAHTFTGDLNTGMWSPAADTLAWSTAGVERARIDSSGRVGIGLTPGSTTNLNILNTAGTYGIQIDRTDTTTRNWGIYVDSAGFYHIDDVTGGAGRFTINLTGDVSIVTDNAALKMYTAAVAYSVLWIDANGFLQLGAANGGAGPSIPRVAAASLPAGAALRDGMIAIDSTNGRLVTYAGGARYYHAGVAF